MVKGPGWHGTGLRILVVSLLLLGLPLAGVWLAGKPLAPYLDFPPRTVHVDHAPFSWPVFIALALLAGALFTGLLWLLWPVRTEKRIASRPMPAWGWLGLAIMLLFWWLAWNRFDIFRPLQAHTFTPLWLGYILFVNGLAFRRSGHSLLTDDPRGLLRLFPLSALFWWYFEYLNRFVQNWHYVGIEDFGPLAYALHASFAFSTVLPAVMSTLVWLRTFPGLGARRHPPPWHLPHRRDAGGLLLGIGAAGLAGIGLWPDALFPLLWVAPLLLVVALQMIAGEPTVFAAVADGNWRNVSLPALAALLCGALWELWNAGSLAHWIYLIPWVQRFHLFEMPLLGYAGYLPFGLECLAIAALAVPKLGSDPWPVRG